MERTLAIIKPDGVSRGLIGEVIKRLEINDFKIMAMKMVHLSKKQAQGFYAVPQGKPFFESLTDFMSSGPAVVMILEGEDVIARYRELMGATNYKEAAEGTIRKEFATDIESGMQLIDSKHKNVLVCGSFYFISCFKQYIDHSISSSKRALQV